MYVVELWKTGAATAVAAAVFFVIFEKCHMEHRIPYYLFHKSEVLKISQVLVLNVNVYLYILEFDS